MYFLITNVSNVINHHTVFLQVGWKLCIGGWVAQNGQKWHSAQPCRATPHDYVCGFALQGKMGWRECGHFTPVYSFSMNLNGLRVVGICSKLHTKNKIRYCSRLESFFTRILSCFKLKPF